MKDEQQIQNQRTTGFLGWFYWKTWHPLNRVNNVMFLSVGLGILAIILAIISIAFYTQVKAYPIIYVSEGKCTEKSGSSTCTNQIKIDSALTPPILFLYYIENTYINHRKYLNSFSANQLTGKTIDIKQANTDCLESFATNGNVNQTVSYGGSPLDSQSVASPCGFMANLIFNDTFKLYSPSGSQIQITEADIISNGQKKILGYKQAPSSSSTQWINPEDERFMNWMQTQPLLTKYKMWGKITQPLPAGTYSVVSDNNFHVGTQKIKKGIEIIKPSKIGGKILLFPIVFGIIALLCFGYAVMIKLTLSKHDRYRDEEAQSRRTV